MSLRRESALMFASRVAAFMGQAGSGLVLARLLGPAGRGELALLLLLPTLAAMILGFGMGPANAYFASQARAASTRQSPVEHLFVNSLWMGLLLGCVGIMLVFSAQNSILATFMRGVAPSHLRLAIMAAPLLLLFAFFQGLAQGEQRFGLYNGVMVLRPTIFLVAFLLLLMTAGNGVRAGLWSFSLAYAVSVLWLAMALRPRPSLNAWPRNLSSRNLGAVELENPGSLKFLPNVAALKEQMRFGLPSYIAELLGYLFLRINLLLIGFYLDSQQAGYFAIVLLVAETLWLLANSVSAVLLPMAAERSPEQLRTLVPTAVRNVIFLTTCSILLLLTVDRWLITFGFGDDFAPAVLPLRLLYPGILAASAAKVFSSYLLSQGRPQLTAAIGALGMAMNLLISFWLIPLLGTAGASLAVSCSYLLMAGIMAGWFVWHTEARASSLFWPRREDWRLYRDTILVLKAQAGRLCKSD